DEKHRGGMVHGVVASGKVYTDGRNAESSGQLLDRLRVSCETDEIGVERMRVLANHRWGVTLRVHGHKQHLKPWDGDGLFDLRELRQRRGTDIGTVCEAEEYEAGFSFQFVHREGSTQVVGNVELRHGATSLQPCSACKLRG